MKMYQTRSQVLKAAHRIRKIQGCSFGEAQRQAWAQFHSQSSDIALLTFRKVSGEICTRMVYAGDLTDYITPKGTGRPVGPDRRLFVDLAKVWAGDRNPVISVYKSNILSLAA